MTGDEREHLRVLTMREWNAGIRGATGSCSNSRHHFKPNTCRGQRLELFTAATKDEWITALQTADALASTRVLDEQGIDLCLGDVRAAWRFADKEALGIAARQFQHLIGNQT